MSWIPEGGRVHELPPELNFSPNSFSQAYARLHRNGIAYTITTFVHNAGSGRFWHYRDQRTITVREAARLQSFDDNFVFVGTRSDQERHAGNAVPPLLAEALADHIYTAFFIPSLAPIRRASS
jgi:DNA (cytosine-5)-methyltransferase 1